MKILVDADGTNRIRQVEDIAKRFKIPVTLYCDRSRFLESSYSSIVYCDVSMDSADIKLFNQCQKGDIVVTNDIGLAGITLAKGAKVIHGCGRIISDRTIDRELGYRGVKQRMRRNTKHISEWRRITFENPKKEECNFPKNLIKLISDNNANTASE